MDKKQFIIAIFAGIVIGIGLAATFFLQKDVITNTTLEIYEKITKNKAGESEKLEEVKEVKTENIIGLWQGSADESPNIYMEFSEKEYKKILIKDTEKNQKNSEEVIEKGTWQVVDRKIVLTKEDSSLIEQQLILEEAKRLKFQFLSIGGEPFYFKGMKIENPNEVRWN